MSVAQVIRYCNLGPYCNFSILNRIVIWETWPNGQNILPNQIVATHYFSFFSLPMAFFSFFSFHHFFCFFLISFLLSFSRFLLYLFFFRDFTVSPSGTQLTSSPAPHHATKGQPASPIPTASCEASFFSSLIGVTNSRLKST